MNFSSGFPGIGVVRSATTESPAEVHDPVWRIPLHDPALAWKANHEDSKEEEGAAREIAGEPKKSKL